MIRRSLRIGIRLGMLGGLAFALFKIAQARRPLPAAPPGEDPWAPSRDPAPSRAPAPSRDPAPSPAPAPAPASDEPALVQPTMLHSTSLKRRRAEGGDPAFDPADTAPPVVRPDSPFAPTSPPAPAPAPPAAIEIEMEIEPDDDEVVILTTGEPTTAPTTTDPAVEVAPAAPAAPAAPTQGAAKKAAAKKSAAKAAAKKAARKPPARKAAAKKSAAKTASGKAAAWVEPVDGVCPTTHPVKGKLRSTIFHLPGMAAYARTNPDRCYRDEGAATDDGLRKAAR